MLLGTLSLLLFLNPNRGIFIEHILQTPTIFTKQPGCGHAPWLCGFYSVEYEICSLSHIYATFPS